MSSMRSYDYHITDPKEVGVYPPGTPSAGRMRWRSQCVCGWYGQIFDNEHDADDDGIDHAKLENEVMNRKDGGHR